MASGLDINVCVLSYFEGTVYLHCYTSCTLTTLHCSKVSFLQCSHMKRCNTIFTKMWGVYSLLWDTVYSYIQTKRKTNAPNQPGVKTAQKLPAPFNSCINQFHSISPKNASLFWLPQSLCSEECGTVINFWEMSRDSCLYVCVVITN